MRINKRNSYILSISTILLLCISAAQATNEFVELSIKVKDNSPAQKISWVFDNGTLHTNFHSCIPYKITLGPRNTATESYNKYNLTFMRQNLKYSIRISNNNINNKWEILNGTYDGVAMDPKTPWTFAEEPTIINLEEKYQLMQTFIKRVNDNKDWGNFGSDTEVSNCSIS